jgi:hypothetical protein
MTQKFVRYGPDVETIEPDFEHVPVGRRKLLPVPEGHSRSRRRLRWGTRAIRPRS